MTGKTSAGRSRTASARELRLRRALRLRMLALVASLAPALLALAAALPGTRGAALADPPAPPGGTNNVYFGGNNRAGYPPLNTVAVTPPRTTPPATGLALRALPNPFTGGVLLTFTAGGERAAVSVFSRDGRLVRRLAASRAGEGAWQAAWNGRDDRGRSVAPGVYLARVEAGGRTGTLRIVRLK